MPLEFGRVGGQRLVGRIDLDDLTTPSPDHASLLEAREGCLDFSLAEALGQEPGPPWRRQTQEEEIDASHQLVAQGRSVRCGHFLTLWREDDIVRNPPPFGLDEG